MANRAVLACVEECCRRVMNDSTIFGSKVVILLGDFRQTCPIVPGGTKADVLNACISQSPFWDWFEVAWLITPIRNAEDPEFASFVDQIGDGAGPRVDLSFLAHTTETTEVIHFVYNENVLQNPTACLRRCILVPTNAQVDTYNAAVLDRLTSTTRNYNAADSLEEHTEVMDGIFADSNVQSPLTNPDAGLLPYSEDRRYLPPLAQSLHRYGPGKQCAG